MMSNFLWGWGCVLSTINPDKLGAILLFPRNFRKASHQKRAERAFPAGLWVQRDYSRMLTSTDLEKYANDHSITLKRWWGKYTSPNRTHYSQDSMKNICWNPPGDQGLIKIHLGPIHPSCWSTSQGWRREIFVKKTKKRCKWFWFLLILWHFFPHLSQLLIKKTVSYTIYALILVKIQGFQDFLFFIISAEWGNFTLSAYLFKLKQCIFIKVLA